MNDTPTLENIETGKLVDLDDMATGNDGNQYRLKGILGNFNEAGELKWRIWLKGIEGSIPDQQPDFIGCKFVF